MATCFAPLVCPAASPERVGTYDSRLVAFAAFWDTTHQAKLAAQINDARAAKEQGDRTRHDAINREIAVQQRQMHLQVFSTAPIDELLATLAEHLPKLQQEAGVSRLISQWDETALAGIPNAARVDVTDQLVREFKLPDDKLRQLDQLKAKFKTTKPLPLWRARLMAKLHLL